MDAEGMGDVDWNELQRNLEATIPVYDKINRFATFRQVDRWRKMVAARLPADGEILEIGCGPGSFAEILEGRNLTCLDPIQAMLEAAEPRVNAKRRERGDPMAKFVEGTAEKLPFPDNSFDAACTLFSFRDWFDKRAGLSETLRVLRPGGKLVIVDPAKINAVHGWLGHGYMKYWVGGYARWICGVEDHPWKWLTKTYVHFGTTRDYVEMMNEVGFDEVKAKVIFPGMATIWEGLAPSHPQ
ncbi:MAG: class I SAM-dependent methyltransferase [Candidatus Thalassarchaeaceae archaeon]|nr:class I SAM-dependent methyltransferase [Candidatus Thalassarchaeaceae archaeon]